MATHLHRFIALGSAGLAAFMSMGVSAQATIDGVVSPGEYGAPLAVQTVGTGFGDNVNELNAAYANLLGDGSIDLALTGNLETSGNGIVIFLDTRAGGAVQNVLGGGYGQLGTFGGQRVDDWGADIDGDFGVFTPNGPSILDPGFNPDVAIEFNASGGDRYINIIDLTVNANDPLTPNRDYFLGSAPGGSGAVTQQYWRDIGGGVFVPAGSITHDFDNSNAAGVNGFGFPAGNPLTSTTGLELNLDALFLNADPGHEIKAMAFITNGGGDYLSNQFLPALEDPAFGSNVDNLGGSGFDPGGIPLFDARQFSSTQYFAIPEPGGLAMLVCLSLLLVRRGLH